MDGDEPLTIEQQSEIRREQSRQHNQQANDATRQAAEAGAARLREAARKVSHAPGGFAGRGAGADPPTSAMIAASLNSKRGISTLLSRHDAEAVSAGGGHVIDATSLAREFHRQHGPDATRQIYARRSEIIATYGPSLKGRAVTIDETLPREIALAIIAVVNDEGSSKTC